MHVVLLGDSIFDNGAYTGGAPDVNSHLRSLLPRSGTSTLLAVDGARVADLRPQSARVPRDATHLVISIGGNDALGNMDLLSLRVSSSAEALRVFATRLGWFEQQYRAALTHVLARKVPTAVCTIYNGALESDIAPIARLGVALFNDVIIRTAVSLAVDVIELRAICTEPGDYANPIEPSGSGGLKIASALVRALHAADHRERLTHVIGN